MTNELQKALDAEFAKRTREAAAALPRFQSVHDLCNRLHSEGSEEVARAIRNCLVAQLMRDPNTTPEQFAQMMLNYTK